MTPVEQAWMSGYLSGRGSFSIIDPSRGRYKLKATVRLTVGSSRADDAFIRFAQLAGANITFAKARRNSPERAIVFIQGGRLDTLMTEVWEQLSSRVRKRYEDCVAEAQRRDEQRVVDNCLLVS